MRADQRQQEYFDRARNQYPRVALADPPLHTAMETRRVLAALRAAGVVDGPIIDFGAGTGRLTIPLARAGYRVLAVDISRASLDVLESVARDNGLHSIETASELPEGAFPAVVGCDVLHHIDMREYLPRIHELLRPGGTVIFSEPGALNPAWYLYLALRHDIRIESRIVTCNIVSLRTALVQGGFRDVTITGLGVLPRPLFRFSARGCRSHDAMGNWWLLKLFAYRYIVQATA